MNKYLIAGLQAIGLPLPRRIKEELAIIVESGLFDPDWYSLRGGSSPNPTFEYYFGGYRGGRSCNYLFDELWYLRTYPDVRKSGMHPLIHFIKYGENENRSPSPLFDVAGYRQQLVNEPRDGLLKHYLNGGWKQGCKPIKYFDTPYYLREWPDVATQGADPYFHFLFTGFKEGRRPSRRYSFDDYGRQHGLSNSSDISSLAHFLYNSGNEVLISPQGQVSANKTTAERSLLSELNEYRLPGPLHEESLLDVIPNKPIRAKVIAFYLPQFHAIPENDRWWGKGFTEWTNATKALPRFAEHYQPHLAGDLGYYDLRNPECIAAQIALARQAGVSGFSFHYYNFNGKRLLEKSVELFLAHPEWSIEFCLTWANENWTRRWDGLENDVLMSQDYLEECDEALVADVARHFRDSRYIRIDGRPLFIIYRPGIIPDAAERVEKWRKLFKEIHGECPLIFMAQGFGDHDPNLFGLDGAIEFPPHKVAVGLQNKNSSLQIFDPNFSGVYFSYDDLVASSLKINPPDYPLIRTAVPMWDNDARKPNRGMGFVGSTPAKYEKWLSSLINFARQNPICGNESLVFVNAWNEWAEGAHLEPDVYWGHGYLNATKRAVTGYSDHKEVSIVFVGHDAHRHGAQLVSLNIIKTLVRRFGVKVEVILLEGGPLEAAFSEIAPTHVLGNNTEKFELALDEILRRTNAQYAICNTTVTGKYCKVLSEKGLKAISLVHEMSNLISERNLFEEAKNIVEYSEKIVFPAAFVRDSFESIVGSLKGRGVVRPQGIYQDLVLDSAATERFRSEYQIPESAILVVNVAYGDLRKGYDIFVQMAQTAVRRRSDIYFLWIGDVEENLSRWLSRQIDSIGKNFIQIPFTNKFLTALANANVFCLTSREDPFPSVVLNALAVGVPVVGFENAGGFSDLFSEQNNGKLVPYGDSDAMLEAILDIAENDSSSARELRKSVTSSRFDWADYVFSLTELLCPGLKRVSVVVPNYNCAPYIEQRLVSIFRQQYPIYEVIVLDDASTDVSIPSIHEIVGEYKREIKLICNEKNSGSAFHQWIKGAKSARGEFLWIAEADDSADRRFLSKLISSMNEDVVMAFCDSEQIDGHGNKLADDYQYYYKTIDVHQFTSDFCIDGKQFVRKFLGVKNLILNVSSAIFRRADFCQLVNQHREQMLGMKVAGDWFFYVNFLWNEDKKIKFVKEPLNVHRRHQGSVTGSLSKQRHYDEVEGVQSYVLKLAGVSIHNNENLENYRRELKTQLGLDQSLNTLSRDV